MEKKNIIFYKETYLQKVRNYVLDVISLGIFVYCCFHISENPVVLIIVMAFILYSVLTSGYNRVLVSNDGVQFEYKQIIDELSTKLFFGFEDIKRIDANLQLSKKGFWASEILTTYMPGNSIWNTIQVELKDGTKKEINTKIYKNDLIEALALIHRMSRGKIVITGM